MTNLGKGKIKKKLDGESHGQPGQHRPQAVRHFRGCGARVNGLKQNIRLYERRGLLTPERTDGGTRQYSESDLAVLRRIAELLDEGLNLAGVAKVLELELDNARLRGQWHQRARARSARPDDAD